MGETVYDDGRWWKKTGRPKKTWQGRVKNDMSNGGVSDKDAQFRKNGEGELRRQPANPGSPG